MLIILSLHRTCSLRKTTHKTYKIRKKLYIAKKVTKAFEIKCYYFTVLRYSNLQQQATDGTIAVLSLILELLQSLGPVHFGNSRLQQGFSIQGCSFVFRRCTSYSVPTFLNFIEHATIVRVKEISAC